MGLNNGQWVRLQQGDDWELVNAAVQVERWLMEVAENFLLAKSGLTPTLIEVMTEPAQLNKYREIRNVLVTVGTVNEQTLRREALRVLSGQ